MSTRGTAFFEIQNALNEEPSVLGCVQIYSDGYPSGFGQEMVKIFDDAYIGELSESGKKIFKNIESIVLKIMSDYPSGYYDDEYIYRFTFKPYMVENPTYLISDILAIKVENRSNNFTGSFPEFKLFCD